MTTAFACAGNPPRALVGAVSPSPPRVAAVRLHDPAPLPARTPGVRSGSGPHGAPMGLRDAQLQGWRRKNGTGRPSGTDEQPLYVRPMPPARTTEAARPAAFPLHGGPVRSSRCPPRTCVAAAADIPAARCPRGPGWGLHGSRSDPYTPPTFAQPNDNDIIIRGVQLRQFPDAGRSPGGPPRRASRPHGQPKTSPLPWCPGLFTAQALRCALIIHSCG